MWALEAKDVLETVAGAPGSLGTTWALLLPPRCSESVRAETQTPMHRVPGVEPPRVPGNGTPRVIGQLLHFCKKQKPKNAIGISVVIMNL